jgi:predicted ester cyclase
MSEQNKENMRRVLEEAFGQGKVEVIDEVLHPDFVCWDPNSESGEIRGADTIKGEIEYFHNAVPDLTYTVEDQVSEDDKVVSRYMVRGNPPRRVLRGPREWQAYRDDGHPDRPLRREWQAY